ncbi:MAG: M28 family peptidase [Verrucomicrobia bacterium]|nr:M28 family peptidase [Verrucomicrobiota bacterium]
MHCSPRFVPALLPSGFRCALLTLLAGGAGVAASPLFAQSAAPVAAASAAAASNPAGASSPVANLAPAATSSPAGTMLPAAANAVPSTAVEAGARAHAMLTHLCDDAGGRLTGSPADRRAIEVLVRELRALGLEPEREPFRMPGWERLEDRVDVVAPFGRRLRVAALGYSQPHAPFAAELIDLRNGGPADYPDEDVSGKVGLISPGTPLQTAEFVRIAAERRVGALLFINREGGGQLLARTGSFVGAPLPLPVYSIAQEEGNWLRRLRERGTPVRLRVETRSRCLEVETANLVLRFPGRSPERIVVGAHVDSWDLGQGALDNGLGVAQLFALADLLRGRDLGRTVEIVWLNGEEQGFWGSRHQAARLGDEPVVAMINLDMVGVPIAVNALGDDTLVPFLERWNDLRGAKRLPTGVQNINWFASDHTPYQLAGVRAITFNAPIPRDSVRYYHDLADTIDKLPEQIVVDSTGVIADLVLALAADTSLGAWRRPPQETEQLFTRFGLERRMQAVGYWPFGPR